MFAGACNRSSILMRQFATAVLIWLQYYNTMPLNMAIHSIEVISDLSECGRHRGCRQVAVVDVAVDVDRQVPEDILVRVLDVLDSPPQRCRSPPRADVCDVAGVIYPGDQGSPDFLLLVHAWHGLIPAVSCTTKYRTSVWWWWWQGMRSFPGWQWPPRCTLVGLYNKTPVDAVDKAASKDIGDVAGDPWSSHMLGGGSGGTRMAESLSCRALSIFRRFLLSRRIFLVKDQGHTPGLEHICNCLTSRHLRHAIRQHPFRTHPFRLARQSLQLLLNAQDVNGCPLVLLACESRLPDCVKEAFRVYHQHGLPTSASGLRSSRILVWIHHQRDQNFGHHDLVQGGWAWLSFCRQTWATHPVQLVGSPLGLLRRRRRPCSCTVGTWGRHLGWSPPGGGGGGGSSGSSSPNRSSIHGRSRMSRYWVVRRARSAFRSCRAACGSGAWTYPVSCTSGRIWCGPHRNELGNRKGIGNELGNRKFIGKTRHFAFSLWIFYFLIHFLFPFLFPNSFPNYPSLFPNSFFIQKQEPNYFLAKIITKIEKSNEKMNEEIEKKIGNEWESGKWRENAKKKIANELGNRKSIGKMRHFAFSLWIVEAGLPDHAGTSIVDQYMVLLLAFPEILHHGPPELGIRVRFDEGLLCL